MPLKAEQDKPFENVDHSADKPPKKIGKQKGKYARLQAARVAFSKIRHDREMWEQAGVGPGDAYLAMWSHLIELRNQWHSQQTDEGKRYYSERYIEVLKALLPFERPRLAVVRVKSDVDRQVIDPETMARQLAKTLTPQELELLDKIAIKMVAAPEVVEAKAEPVPEPKRRK
jgi:hypothetical protein